MKPLEMADQLAVEAYEVVNCIESGCGVLGVYLCWSTEANC